MSTDIKGLLGGFNNIHKTQNLGVQKKYPIIPLLYSNYKAIVSIAIEAQLVFDYIYVILYCKQRGIIRCIKEPGDEFQLLKQKCTKNQFTLS